MPCALRQLRAACAQLRLSNYGSVRLRLRMEARGPLLRGSGGGHHSSGHLRRTSRDPSRTGDYSWTQGLNKSSLRFFVRSQGLTAAGTHVEDLLSCSRDESGWWLHLGQRGMCWINGPLPPSCCRTQDTSRMARGHREHRIPLWILTEQRGYSGMFLSSWAEEPRFGP